MDVTQLFTPEFKRNPYPFYDAIRAEGEVVTLDGLETSVVTSYAGVREALRRPDLRSGMSADFVATGGGEERWRERSPTTWAFSQQALLFRSGADHGRLRRLVSKAFTPRVVSGLRARVEGLVDSLLDEIDDRREMDLISDFAYPLPLVVIAELLGVAVEDREKLRSWSAPIAAILDGATRQTELDRAEPAAAALKDFLSQEIDRHREEPGDDLIDGLLAAVDEGDRLSEEEMVATCMLILIAGHETTTNLLASGMLAMLRQGDAWDELCCEPGLAPSAVDELLRFDGPVQFTSRRTVGRVEFRGHTIEDDQELMLVLGAANRDPAHFEAPNRIDIRRQPNDHLAFGLGSHFCLGSSLARMEASVALFGLATRLPGLELAADPDTLSYRPGFAIRALEKLPLRW